jgi:hypothetical protein
MRMSRIVAAAAVAAVLAGVFACTRGPSPTPAGSATPAATPAPVATGGPVPASPVAPAASGTGRSRSAPVTLTVTETRPTAACGITIRARFLPPSGTGRSQLQAFLVGQGLGVPGGDQPAPGAVAPARQGTVATVLGHRFGIVAVDIAQRSVRVQPLC